MFDELAKVAQQCSKELVSRAALAARGIIGQIIIDEVKDGEAALKTVVKTVSVLQSVIRDGLRPDASMFSKELGINDDQEKKDSPAGMVALPENVDEAILIEFLSQQSSVTEEMERLILKLETASDDETMATLKRILHTLKGEAGVLGLSQVGRICHEVEGYIEEKGMGISTDKLLGVTDWFSQIFDAYAGKGSMPSDADHLISRLFSEEEGEKVDSSSPEKESPGPLSCESGESKKDESSGSLPDLDPDLLSDFIAESKEHLDSADLQLLALETDPENVEAINAVFRAFHTIKGVAGFLELKDFFLLAHEAESLLDRARKGEVVFSGQVVDVTFTALDRLKHYVGELGGILSSGKPLTTDDTLPKLLTDIRGAGSGSKQINDSPKPVSAEERKIGEILVEDGVATQADVDDALEEQKRREVPRLGQLLVGQKQVAAKDVASALRKQQGVIKVRDTVKLDTDRLDRMIDAIGELVIAESMVGNDPDIKDIVSERVHRNLRQLGKITRELQEIGMSMRMVPLKSTFQKMARLTRDLAKKSGKKINFIMNGEDTKLDKGHVIALDRIPAEIIKYARSV